VILGAGLSGCIAAGATQNFADELEVYEAKSENKAGLSEHKAVMRIRTDKIKDILGCSLKPIKVNKMVFFGNELKDKADITVNNLYSSKVSGEILPKSIETLGKVDRFLLEGSPKCSKVNWNCTLVSADLNRNLQFEDKTKNRFIVDYDYCISTLPMPVLLKSCNISYDFEFKANPIFVRRFRYKGTSCVNQTIYIPSREFSCYRITLQNNLLIFEGVSDISDGEIEQLAKLFGIADISEIENEESICMKMGKILSIPEKERKAIIWRLTEEYRIYSLGRYAIWKSIRADDVVEDIDAIKRLIELDAINENYSIRKEWRDGN
jgi:hypothetical protein